MPHYRLIILGAGTAGLTAFSQAHRETGDVLLIDPGPLGTTCARVGCMPSKALLQVAREVDAAGRLRRDGLLLGDPLRIDGAAVMAKVRRLRDRFVSGPLRTIEGLGDRFVKGAARFVGPDRIEVVGERYSADAFIVATGTRPVVPTEWQALGDRLLTSDTLFEMPALPESLAVIGLGPIGVELGQALAMLGVRVAAFGRNARLAGSGSAAVNALAHEALGESMSIHTGHEVALEPCDGGVLVRFGATQFQVERVLAAIGRRPAVGDLNLAALGLPLDRQGLPTIDPRMLRAGTSRVYFAGDVNGIAPLMHEAADDGRLSAWYALHPDAECLTRRTPLAMVFCEPQLARCGVSGADLPAGTVTGRVDFGGQGRSIILGYRRGLLEVHADPEGRLIGAEMICAGAEHLAHQLAWLIQRRTTVTEALQLPFYHPVLEEGLRSALQDLRRQLPERVSRPDLPLCGNLDEVMPGG